MEQKTLTEQNAKIVRCKMYVCKSKFNSINLAVHNHNHSYGEYRGTVCNKFNLKMQKPKFISFFL